MIVYAFDVDETLEVSGGPIPMAKLRDLSADGHVVGLCGNWAVVVARVSDWQQFINFLGPMNMSKAEFLRQIMAYIPAEAYVMVGNVLGVSGASDDQGSAKSAGWSFMSETEFAARRNVCAE